MSTNQTTISGDVLALSTEENSDDEPTTGNEWLDKRLAEHVTSYPGGFDEELFEAAVERPLSFLSIADVTAASTKASNLADDEAKRRPIVPYRCRVDECDFVRPFVLDGNSVHHRCPECGEGSPFHRLAPVERRRLGEDFSAILGGFR